MNEEFAIAFKLAIDESSISKVKQRLEELKKELQTTIDIVPKVKEQVQQTSMPTIEPTVSTNGLKDYSAQIEFLKAKADDLKATLSSLDENVYPSDVLGYRVELEKVSNQLTDLVNKQNNLSSATKKTVSEAKKLSFKSVSDSIKDATKSAKVFTLALIGARSIYAGIRKAMSTYLSQNEELQNKLNACYYAIGSLFAPVLEKLVSIFATLIGYVNVFLKALGFAGINMSNFGKSASSSAKSAKEINKSLSGFDELNNIGTQESSSGGVGGTDVSNPFENQDLDLTWVERIQAFGEWCLNNIPLISGVLLGVAGAIAAIKLGCDGIQALGIGLMIGGIVGAIASLMEYLKSPTWESFGGIISGIGVAIIGLGLVIGSVPVAIAGAIVLVMGILMSHWEAIKQWLQNLEDGVGNAITNIREWLNNNLGIMGALIDLSLSGFLGLVKGFIEGVKDFLDLLFQGIRDIVDGVIMIFNGDLKGGIEKIMQGIWEIIESVAMLVWDIVKNVVGNVWDSIKNLAQQISERVSKVWTDLKSVFSSGITWILQKVSNLWSKIISGFTTFWSTMGSKAKEWVCNIINKYIINNVNKLISWINDKLHFSYSGLSLLGKQIIPSFDVQLAHLNTLPQLNVGTDYVPNDMVAQLHKGEAVIPKKFNDRDYFSGNSDETNSLLETLIDKVDAIELNPYITVKDVGKASVKYINQQSRILGNNLI